MPLRVACFLAPFCIDVDMVSVTDAKSVTGSHKITVEMDKRFDEVDFEKTEMMLV